MPAPTNVHEFRVPVPPLRVFAKLDVDLLTPNVAEGLAAKEGRADYVDIGLARDFEISEEIGLARIGAAIVSEDGKILSEFEGVDATSRAERAMSKAKVTFSLDLGDVDEPAKPKRNSGSGATRQPKPATPEAEPAAAPDMPF